MRATLFFQCDGEAISLPNLQGIVVLNITSYAGGVNFWGGNTATTVSMERNRVEKVMALLRSLR
jgi:diacylglycerol kinase (ATP)